MEQGQDRMPNVLRFQSVPSGVFQHCRQQHGGWYCYAAQVSSEFTPNHWLQLIMEHLTVMVAIYCHTLFLIILEDWFLRILKQRKHNVSH